MALEDDIHIRETGKTGRITLTRPQALNAMSYDMCLAIERALFKWRNDDAVALVLIDAEGERAFCSGGDIQELYDTGLAGDFEYGRKFWADEYRLNAMLAAYPKPYVAVMDGIVMGGGVGISAHGSHRIVTENTLFAMPECGIGLVPDVGASAILAKANHSIGYYLGLTGARLNAGDTILAGFADVFVPAEEVEELIEVLELSGNPFDIAAFGREPEPGFLFEKQAVINEHFSLPTALEIAQTLERSNDDWCFDQARLMRRGCSLSVASAHQIIRFVAKNPTVPNALKWEYRFTHRSMSDGEFIEGVRAQIIDKDRSPKWQVPSLEAVTAEMIDTMLAPLGERDFAA